MKIGFPFQKTPKKEYFLALVLRNEKINAVFFEESQGAVRVLGSHTEKFENSIEEASVDELLDTADKAISAAEQYLPKTTETVKTVFGVKGSWVEEAKIKKDYLLKLKKISGELGLIPIGFIVIFEAIAFLLEKEEGAPVSIILVETGEKFVSAALIKAGKIKEFKTGEIADSPASTLDNILKHFTSSEVFPQKIVVFNENEDESQEFINFKWSKGLPFLHIPQVTTLPSDFDARAVLHGAANQLGFEVLNEPPQDEEMIGTIEPKEKDDRDEIPYGKVKIVPQEGSLEYFGFINDRDIGKVPLPSQKIETKQIPDGEISDEETPREIEDLPARLAAKRAGEAGIPEEVKEKEAGKKALPLNALAILMGGKKVLSTLLKSGGGFPIKNFPIFSFSGRGKIVFIPLFLLIFLLVALFFYFFSNKATVVLEINAKTSEKLQDIIFASDTTSDPGSGILASQFLSVTKEGSASTKTTGKKEVGTFAKGTVTIFNNSSSSQALSSNTTITSSNDLEFTLDKNITVASASGDIFSGTTPGKGEVSVTAKKIGQEYNLPSNTKFTIGGSSSVAAKNDDAFSGGTKKEVTVVSEGDIKKLREELPKTLEEKAKEELSKKISGDDVLLPVLINEGLIKEKFSKDIDDEAGELSLSGTVSYKGVSYKREDALDFAKEVLKNEISDNETVDSDSLKVNVEGIKQEDDNVSARVSIEGFIIPKIDNNLIVKQISGKSFNRASEILMKHPQVSGVEIKLSFSLPLLPKIVPFSKESINISTKVNE